MIAMRSLSTQHAKVSQQILAMYKHSFDSLRAKLTDALHDHSYKTPFSFLSPLTDKSLLDTLRSLYLQKNTPVLKKIFVVGIGGANLGAKAIIDTLPKTTSRPEFIFLDTLYEGESDELISMILDIETLDQCLVLIISKSGKTLETLSGAQLIISILERKLGSITERLVAVTAESSPLYVWANACNISTIALPQVISDRYSVFTSIGVLPLLFAGFDIDEFYAGALEALQSNLPMTIGPSFQAACALYANNPKNVHGILDLFFFSEKLETLGKWGRQLIAESLGKESTITGFPLNRSLTPTVSIGTTDLHSMLQLYLAQPQERITWFTTLTSEGTHPIGLPIKLKAILPTIDTESPEHILKIIYEQISKIYQTQGIPYLHTKLDDQSPKDFGYYMMSTILVTLGLAQLWQIDPWNQPNVEEYKDAVRKELENTE